MLYQVWRVGWEKESGEEAKGWSHMTKLLSHPKGAVVICYQYLP